MCFVCVCFWSPHSQGEYAAGSGDTQYGAARGGRIPGAVWFWWEDLFRDGNLKPAAAILQELQANGVRVHDPAVTVVSYCTGGIRSGFVYMVLLWAGVDRVQNYDGSWWEWAAAVP